MQHFILQQSAKAYQKKLVDQYLRLKLLDATFTKKNIRVLNIPTIQKGSWTPYYRACDCAINRSQLENQKLTQLVVFFLITTFSYSLSKRPHINDALLKYLKPYVKTIIYEWHESFWERLKFKLAAPLLYPELYDSILLQTASPYEVDAKHFMSDLRSNAGMFETHAMDPSHLFTILKKDERVGERFLKQHKIPKSAWFATCHVRTHRFYKGLSYETEYANRCANIDSYELAIQKIVDSGGYCFFIGNVPDLFTPKIKSFKDKVINIANTGFNEDLLSPFLFGKAKFFLGCNSGPSIIPGNFNIPTVQVNTSPFWGIPIHHFDLFIFKKLWSQKLQRQLTMEEMFEDPLPYTNLDSQFKKLKLTVVDNTPEEVAELVEEMLLRLFYNANPTEDNLQRQKRFKKLFPENCYGAKFTANVGHKFLEELECYSSATHSQDKARYSSNVQTH